MSEISVTIHEKRNHPYEYGHYDCSVTITGDTYLGERDERIEELREIARRQVAAECDMWIAGIEEEKRIAELHREIGANLNALKDGRWCPRPFSVAKEPVAMIRELSEVEQEGYRSLLRRALAKCAEYWQEKERRSEQLQKAKDECIALRDDYELGDRGDYEEKELLF